MDIELHYEEQGAGEPLILLHGNGGDCSYFSGQMGAFAKRFRTIALDTRGHGASPRGEKPFTISQFADDLADFMDERGIARAHLLGFSDGGNIALVFALRHPDRVGRLVLNGANLFFDGLTPAVRCDILDTYERARAAEDRNPAAKRLADLQRLMIDEPNIDPAQLAALDMPALVIVGDDDMIEQEHSRLIADALPQSRMVVLSGSHFVAEEDPAAFNGAALAFLEP